MCNDVNRNNLIRSESRCARSTARFASDAWPSSTITAPLWTTVSVRKYDSSHQLLCVSRTLGANNHRDFIGFIFCLPFAAILFEVHATNCWCHLTLCAVNVFKNELLQTCRSCVHKATTCLAPSRTSLFAHRGCAGLWRMPRCTFYGWYAALHCM